MDLQLDCPIHPAYADHVDSTSIRLLRFSRDENGHFTGQLKKFRLESAPPFYSLSYVWGKKTFSTGITFGSDWLLVLTSLAPFLHMICQHKDFSDKDWWWIDSICMNLDNVEERATQVKIMGDIYRRASRAIIWLGKEREEESDCLGAVEFLKQIADLKSALETSEVLREQIRDKKFAVQWDAVGKLLSRSWWTRVWTLQEFILPREAKFYCGSSSISRCNFKLAMYSIHLCKSHDHKLVPRHAFDAAWNRRRIHQWFTKSNGINLVATMAYLGNHGATDSRDRIYSVLGIITDHDRRLVGDPEYKSGVEQVFANLVRSFWNEYHSLDIVCFTHIFNRYAGSLDTDAVEVVPSWAPDWRAYVQSSPVPLMASQSASEHIGNFRPLNSRDYEAAYDAPGSTLRNRANVRFSHNLKEMWCDGIVLDWIDGLGGLENCKTRCTSNACKEAGHTPQQSLQRQRTNFGTGPGPIQQIEAIAHSLVLDREDKYLRNRAPRHFTSDFLVLCYSCLNGENVDPLFSAWFTQNRDLLIYDGWSLGSIMTYILESPEPSTFSLLPSPSIQIRSSGDGDPYVEKPDEADNFLDRFKDTVRHKSRRLMVTRNGYFGMAPCMAQRGEVVAILFGCSIPLVLRSVGVREAWQVVGEAYVHGFMDGECWRLLDDKERSVKTFRLV
ncbi:uncharacterized protein BDR25DRAFT_346406 [Lindgomyces ingoldianus]|uniref:Uncharacterized protein n=1 Tax=Lindgomyces ingoldianus TaxID=673940 RepID=A0ACB6QDZ6_9PLEO|nr:uncharacterized protein BDR25DRAFT_346406 [Lindgomyces ingoldianus]KAF2464828.1 hypothetical protein BDR25DRAFT_346406 [Lindgomyces ingoldianus]